MARRSVRAIAAAIALALGAVGLSACESDGNDSGKTTLVLMNSQWMDALRGDNLWAVMEKYEKVNPKVVLEKSEVPSKDIQTKLPTELGAKLGPDVMMLQEPLFWVVRDALLPLDEATAEANNLNATNDGAQVEGRQLGVSWQRAAYALVFNKKLLDEAGVEPPETVDELITATQKVQSKTGAIGFTSRHQMNEFDNWYKDFMNWTAGYGGQWATQGQLTIDSPQNIAAVEAFKKLYDADVIPYGDDFPTQRNRFKSGDVGFSIDNSGGTLNMATGSKVSSDVGASRLPFPSPGSHQQIYLALNKNMDGEKQKAALDFVQWLLTDDAQQALRSASGPDLLATDVPLDPKFAKKNPWAQNFYDAAADSSGTVIEGYELETAQIMRPVMDAVERVLTKNADPRKELEKAQEEATGLVG